MAKLDLQTTQNVTIEYDLAGLGDRLFAFVLDLLLVLGTYYLFMAGVVQPLVGGVSGWTANVLYGYLPIFLFLGYYFCTEYLIQGQTVGKRALRIRVVQLDNEDPGATDYLLRTVFILIDGIFCLGIIGSLFISSTIKRQRLGDLVANTSVIKLPKTLQFRLEDILKISSIEEYEPVFPEIKRIEERDMLFVKRLLNRYHAHPNEAHRRALLLAVEKFESVLHIQRGELTPVHFLQTLLKDYIVLTR